MNSAHRWSNFVFFIKTWWCLCLQGQPGGVLPCLEPACIIDVGAKHTLIHYLPLQAALACNFRTCVWFFFCWVDNSGFNLRTALPLGQDQGWLRVKCWCCRRCTNLWVLFLVQQLLTLLQRNSLRLVFCWKIWYSLWVHPKRKGLSKS